MCGMVKHNDLEDMAEPPLNNDIEISSTAPRQHEGTMSDASAGSEMGSPSNFPFG